MTDLASAVAAFGAAAKRGLANPAISGAPEDQLRTPLVRLVEQLADLTGQRLNAVKLVGETTPSDRSKEVAA